MKLLKKGLDQIVQSVMHNYKFRAMLKHFNFWLYNQRLKCSLRSSGLQFKNNKRLIFCCLSLLISTLAISQYEAPFQKVILKDGNVLNGQLIDSTTTSEQVSIQTFSGAVFHIERKFVKNIVQVGADQKVFTNGKTINNGKLYTNAFWGFLLAKEEDRWGDNEELKVGYTIMHLSLGHRFNRFFSLGGGMSWDQYDQTLFSFFAEVRGELVDYTMSPYYVMRAGYGIPVFNTNSEENFDLTGGYSFHPAIGLRFATHQKTNILLEAGYRFQQMNMEYEDFFNTKDKITLRRLSLRFGLDF